MGDRAGRGVGRTLRRLTAGERARNDYLAAHWSEIISVGLWAAGRVPAAEADDVVQELAIAAVRRYGKLREFADRGPNGLLVWLQSAGRSIAFWLRTGPPSRFDRLRVELDLDLLED